jgi:ribosomal protein S18 acetylase RimI-like enzyme
MHFTIRSLDADDGPAWRALWDAYCAFYETALDARISENTWQSIIDPSAPIHGFIAIGASGEPLGLCNYVLHPHTWSNQTVCYLEDLFVAPAGRRLGIATALIDTLRARGIEDKWSRIYWITHRDNVDAQGLYDRVAVQTPHVRYEIALPSRLPPAALS